MPNILNSDRSNTLSVALIVPNAMRRRALVAAFAGSQLTVAREFEAYPSLADLPCRHCGPAGIAPPACGAAPGIARLACKVVIVDLDDDVEQAIGVIEHICSHNLALTVMAYSSRNDATLMRRSMQAGAREYLVEPLLQETVDELVTRICSRRANREKTAGKALVFVPSEGGVGVTTTALNFALALTKESGAKVVVVDMDFQLGEIASWLGVTATFSVVDALTNATRLDREFLATLLIRHGSGLAVLGSPEDYNFFHPAGEGVKTLFRILREEFDYVVVDAGTCHGAIQETLFEMADTLYLVTEMTFASLRNAHRLISYLSARGGSSHLEVVANRFNSRHGKIDDNSATKALTRPVNWKIPNTYASVRAAQDSGVPLAMEDSPYTRVLAQMARAACGKAVTGTRKASPGFHPFGLRGLPDPAET